MLLTSDWCDCATCKNRKSLHLECLHGILGHHEPADGSLAFFKDSNVDDGPQEPHLELPLAHGGDAFVHQGEDAETFFALSKSHRRGMSLFLQVAMPMSVVCAN